MTLNILIIFSRLKKDKFKRLGLEILR